MPFNIPNTVVKGVHSVEVDGLKSVEHRIALCITPAPDPVHNVTQV